MAFNIYDESLTRVGEIRTVISSTWEEKFADKGICQLVVANSEAASKLLLPGRFVGKNDKSTLWQIKTKEKREGELWINGFTANYSLLDDRVYDGIHTSNVVADDLRAAVIGKRAPGIVALAADRGLTGSVVSEHTYPTLFELSKDLCGSVDYGFRFVHDRAAKKLLLTSSPGRSSQTPSFPRRSAIWQILSCSSPTRILKTLPLSAAKGMAASGYSLCAAIRRPKGLPGMSSSSMRGIFARRTGRHRRHTKIFSKNAACRS